MPPNDLIPRLPRRAPALVALMLAGLLGGCVALPTGAVRPEPAAATAGQEAAPTPPKATPTKADPYDAAKAALVAEDFPRAARLYRRLLATSPEHPRAREAMIELAYVYYRMGDGDSAYATAGRFIRMHPDDPRLDYLFYLRGLSHYGLARQEQQRAPEALSPHAGLAIEAFERLRGRFPDSRYVADADRRIVELRRGLLAQRLALAKRFLNLGDYAAAGLQAQAIVGDGAATDATRAEARTLLKMAYERLGLRVKRKADASRPAASPTTRIHRERWIMAQKASDYTLQIIGSTNEPALRGFVRRQELEGDLAIFRTLRDGKPWYTLIMGRFPDKDQAEKAASGLRGHFPEIRPWVRPMADIQRIVSEQDPLPIEAGPGGTIETRPTKHETGATGEPVPSGPASADSAGGGHGEHE